MLAVLYRIYTPALTPFLLGVYAAPYTPYTPALTPFLLGVYAAPYTPNIRFFLKLF